MGNSFGIRLTKRMFKEYGLKEGDEVKIEISFFVRVVRE